MVFRTFLILFSGAGILLSMATMWQMSNTYHALYGYSNEASNLFDSTREQRSNSNSTYLAVLLTFISVLETLEIITTTKHR